MTPLPPSEAEARELVEVTQADRDAAAHFHAIIFDQELAEETRQGKGDEDELVQAFARHRLATLPPQHSSGDAREVLTWLYERAAEQDEDWAGDNQPVEQGGPGSSGAPMPRNFYFEAARAIEAALSRQDRPEGVGDDDAAIEAAARAICRVHGQEPDEQAPLGLICGPNNEPLPMWCFYEEDARAALASRPAPDGWVLASKALSAWQEWEAEVIRDNAPWGIGGGFKVVGLHYDRYVELQLLREDALAASPSALSGEKGE